MGVEYTGIVSAVAVTAAQDLFELLAPTARSVKLKEVHATQHSDAAVSESELLQFTIKRVTGIPTSGSGGTVPTPTSVVPGITFSGTLEANNTTRITGGTITTLETQAEHIFNGWHYIAPDGKEHEIEGATRFVIGLETAPVDSLTMDLIIKFEVVGGI